MLDMSIKSFLEAVLYNMVITSHMGLFKLKLIKIKNSVHHSH